MKFALVLLWLSLLSVALAEGEDEDDGGSEDGKKWGKHGAGGKMQLDLGKHEGKGDFRNKFGDKKLAFKGAGNKDEDGGEQKFKGMGGGKLDVLGKLGKGGVGGEDGEKGSGKRHGVKEFKKKIKNKLKDGHKEGGVLKKIKSGLKKKKSSKNKHKSDKRNKKQDKEAQPELGDALEQGPETQISQFNADQPQ